MAKQTIITLLVALLSLTVAQGQNRRDAARYNTMTAEGVWSVGVTVVPATSLVHPASEAYGGTISSVGLMGLGLEGGYFVRDEWRVAVELFYADNAYSSAFAKMMGEAYSTQSSFTVGALCYRHFGRWYAGAGLTVGRSSLRYYTAEQEGANNIDRFGEEGFTQRKGSFGLVVSGGYQLSPFMKVGGFWRPSIAGGGYAHSLGVSATIYLPFVDTVVCK